MTSVRAGPDAAALLESVREGNSLAIARAITAIENRTEVGAELGLALRDLRGRCRVLGVTGPPGAGKSSLINALIAELLPTYRRIGVLTVDPSSPVSGGAVLGDRVRMAAHSTNPDIFIRSLASRGHLGGVTRTTRAVIDILAAGGSDLVIVETVGTGQSEVEVADLADIGMVVCAPGFGDEVQALKAGILEIADLLVVNKSDLPDAARTASQLRAMLSHRGHDEARSLHQVSTHGRDGLATLADTIRDRLDRSSEGGPTLAADRSHPRYRLAGDVAELAAAMVREDTDPRMDDIAGDVSRGAISRRDGVIAVIRLLAERHALPDMRRVDVAAAHEGSAS